MNTLHKIVEPHAATPAVPDIPAIVEVPHSMTASVGVRYAAHALNSDSRMAAMHAIHVASIAAGSCKAIQNSARDAYLFFQRETWDLYPLAKHHGCLLYAWHGTKAFEVQA